MGLRTASVRGEVMAPALTDLNAQIKLPPPLKGGASEDELKALIPETLSDAIMSQMDQNMGLKTTNQKDKNDVEQLLCNLTSNTDEDLLQVMKSIDNDHIDKFLDAMNISIEEQDLKETQTKDLMGDLKKKQVKIERRLDFLRRKVRKIQVRHMGQHMSGEVAGVYEYVHRSLKRLKDTTLEDDTTLKPISTTSTKAILKKLEMAASLQANSISRQKHQPKYFGSGSTEPTNHRLNIPGIVNLPPWPIEHKQELQKMTGLMQTELGVVQKEVDSEATESSSGGESCDETQTYTNPHQQYLCIQKRALWKYATSRAAIASRWTWLQSQISDLEYRIRQHTDLHRQIRAKKGDIQLGGIPPPPPSLSPPITVNGYRGQLPGDCSKTESETTFNGVPVDYQCARTRPLINFKKRRLLQINGLHVVSKKAARPSSVRCFCVRGVGRPPCALCTGRTDPTYPRDPQDALSKEERVALVDGGFHPVISMPEDISYSLHCEAIMKNPDWQQRSTRMKSLKIGKSDRSEKSNLVEKKKIDHRRKYNRLKPSTVSALSAKLRNKIRGRKPGRLPSSLHKRSKLSISGSIEDDEVESIENNNSGVLNNSTLVTPSTSPLLQTQTISGFNRRNRTNSYDIDNIVIPYSVAAATRVERLPYKEILTPKWRLADMDLKYDKNNGVIRNASQDSDVEDLNEEVVVVRHDKSEYDEKKKFLSYLKFPLNHRHRVNKRTDSLAESSGGNTPDPLSPHPPDSPLTTPPATPIPEEIPSISALRRRTISQSRVPVREDGGVELPEVPPYEPRTFPIDDSTYDVMLKSMPENHQFKTNVLSQDNEHYYDTKVDSPGTESTESAVGDEDPNDPEWVDMEKRDRQKR